MQLLSINVGQPRLLNWNGREIRTAIFKQPVAGPVALAGFNLAGDAQADLRVHGGPDKAVYAYDASHYAAWRGLLPAWQDWGPGLFGENLTTEGLLETQVRVGDVFGLGTAQLRAVQPRQPCYKLNVRFDDGGMAAHFARAARPGIYFRVEKPGTVQAGDAFTLLEAAATTITIQDVWQLLTARTIAPDRLADVLALPHLPAEVRRYLGGQA
ncbi:MOSC domain-containing protein [Hymenobacter nivis]|uniref:MOSC domain-containing protein n=1 Tax=Hymenobacter nivis TaxID=1850093 RepID=A0A502GYT3_9BACT|nr:MOSC domain-containing protein [Hymenobacter nivis]TPG66488.1 MOSC domain-containing protein [Hymenobacter nivis]